MSILMDGPGPRKHPSTEISKEQRTKLVGGDRGLIEGTEVDTSEVDLYPYPVGQGD